MPVIFLNNLEKLELKGILLKQGVKEYLIKGKTGLDELEQKIKSYLEA